MANYKNGKERQNCSIYLSKKARDNYYEQTKKGVHMAQIVETILETKEYERYIPLFGK